MTRKQTAHRLTRMALPAVLSAALIAIAGTAAEAACATGSAADNKAMILESTRVIWNDGDASAIDRYLDAAYVDHYAPADMPKGRDGLKMMHQAFRGAFPDLTIAFEDQVAEDDRVASRVILTGTHTGDFMGMPATGKPVSVRGLRIDRVCGGKIVEHWPVIDMAGMLAQLTAE